MSVNTEGSSEFASFWHGPLNPFAYACLASFPRAGAKLRLYTYDRGLDVPAEVTLRDAREICPDESLVRRYVANGKPSIATFADMFRYKMIQGTGCCWADTDFVCVREPVFAAEAYVFCRQADAVSTLLINNAVLRLPPSEPALAELVATAEDAVDRDQKWGALGPFLLTPVLERHGLYGKALEPDVCYPIEPEQFWKLFLPDHRSEVEAKTRDATMVHLWSEAIRWSGYDLTASPPAGSYLHECFLRVGALGRFTRISSEAEVRCLMARQIAESERATGSSANEASA
jgi:hypothetical protein